MSTSALILTLIIGVILKVAPASIPTKDGKWLLSKFETHTKLREADTVVTIGGKDVEGADKIQVIQDFNEAAFLKQYYIFPGNEQLFLEPKNRQTPVVITTKKGKKDVQLFLYRYNDYVDVVKQYKKKVVAYSLRSDKLQKMPAAEM